MTHEVRKIAVAWVAAVLVVTLAPRADAHHLPNRWCSDSGDICLGTRRVDGVRTLRLLMNDPYFDRFRLCVQDPDGERVCKRFTVGDAGGELFGADIAWREHFPDKGQGPYTVTWRMLDGTRIGRRLGFHS